MQQHTKKLVSAFVLRIPVIPALMAALLASCGSVSANTPPASVGTTHAAVTDVSATSVSASTPPASVGTTHAAVTDVSATDDREPAELPVTRPDADATAADLPRCDGERERCLREGVDVLARTLPRVGAAPDAELIATLRASSSPAAHAWAVYLAHHAGDDALARRTLDTLAARGERPWMVEEGVTDVATRALSLAREHADLLSGATPDVVGLLPCAVFRWDPAAAQRAFAPAWGSTRDTIIAPFKARCVSESLAQAVPEGQREATERAQEAVARALFGQWPVPADGTIWTAYAIDAHETLLDTLLLLPLAAEVDGEARARELITRLDERDRRRMLAYRGRTEGHVWTLKRAVCAVARSRGEPLTPSQCEMRARGAVLAAFTAWVGSLRQQ